MPAELDMVKERAVSDSPDHGDIPPAFVMRINYLKREIAKSLVLNHNGGDEQLQFLLKRL